MYVFICSFISSFLFSHDGDGDDVGDETHKSYALFSPVYIYIYIFFLPFYFHLFRYGGGGDGGGRRGVATLSEAAPPSYFI